MENIYKPLVYIGITYENYEISITGEVRSKKRIILNKAGLYQNIPGGIMKPRTNKIHPHLFIDIKINSKNKSIYIHRAVYETYVGKPTEEYISFKDGDHNNIHPNNLFCLSHSELQKRNMIIHPKNRWRLSEINKKNGYYDNLAGRPINKILKANIQMLWNLNWKASAIATELNISISTVYKYRTV